MAENNMIENSVAESNVENIITISGGKVLRMQGVLRVDDFDKGRIDLDTTLGRLTIRGRGLHIAQLVLEEQALTVEGEIVAVAFDEGKSGGRKQNSLLKRLTR